MKKLLLMITFLPGISILSSIEAKHTLHLKNSTGQNLQLTVTQKLMTGKKNISKTKQFPLISTGYLTLKTENNDYCFVSPIRINYYSKLDIDEECKNQSFEILKEGKAFILKSIKDKN